MHAHNVEHWRTYLYLYDSSSLIRINFCQIYIQICLAIIYSSHKQRPRQKQIGNKSKINIRDLCLYNGKWHIEWASVEKYLWKYWMNLLYLISYRMASCCVWSRDEQCEKRMFTIFFFLEFWGSSQK